MIKYHLFYCFFVLLITTGFAQEPTSEKAPENFDEIQNNSTKGNLDTISYPSETVGANREAIIYTPPGYEKSRQYPVLYLLHGIGGDQYAWLNNGNVKQILDNLYNKEKIAPMLVVLPNGRAMENDSAEGDIFAEDEVQAFTNFEKDLLNDLIPFVENQYPVLEGKENRALAGLSMGGGQSLNFGLGNPDTFGWVGAFSAAPNTKEGSDLIPNEAAIKENLKLLWISCGDEDDLLNISKRTHELLEEKDIEHIYFIEPGKHDFEVWKNDIYLFSQLLFKE